MTSFHLHLFSHFMLKSFRFATTGFHSPTICSSRYIIYSFRTMSCGFLFPLIAHIVDCSLVSKLKSLRSKITSKCMLHNVHYECMTCMTNKHYNACDRHWYSVPPFPYEQKKGNRSWRLNKSGARAYEKRFSESFQTITFWRPVFKFSAQHLSLAHFFSSCPIRPKAKGW